MRELRPQFPRGLSANCELHTHIELLSFFDSYNHSFGVSYPDKEIKSTIAESTRYVPAFTSKYSCGYNINAEKFYGGGFSFHD